MIKDHLPSSKNCCCSEMSSKPCSCGPLQNRGATDGGLYFGEGQGFKHKKKDLFVNTFELSWTAD
jgi:hypothetical protein